MKTISKGRNTSPSVWDDEAYAVERAAIYQQLLPQQNSIQQAKFRRNQINKRRSLMRHVGRWTGFLFVCMFSTKFMATTHTLRNLSSVVLTSDGNTNNGNNSSLRGYDSDRQISKEGIEIVPNTLEENKKNYQVYERSSILDAIYSFMNRKDDKLNKTTDDDYVESEDTSVFDVISYHTSSEHEQEVTTENEPIEKSIFDQFGSQNNYENIATTERSNNRDNTV